MRVRGRMLQDNDTVFLGDYKDGEADVQLCVTAHRVDHALNRFEFDVWNGGWSGVWQDNVLLIEGDPDDARPALVLIAYAPGSPPDRDYDEWFGVAKADLKASSLSIAWRTAIGRMYPAIKHVRRLQEALSAAGQAFMSFYRKPKPQDARSLDEEESRW